jgi:acyl carrier protein
VSEPLGAGAGRDVLAEVKAVLLEALGIAERADSIGASTPLRDSLPELDSMAVLELMTSLERRFGVTFDDEEVTGEVFETLGSLAGLVETKLR